MGGRGNCRSKEFDTELVWDLGVKLACVVGVGWLLCLRRSGWLVGNAGREWGRLLSTRVTGLVKGRGLVAPARGMDKRRSVGRGDTLAPSCRPRLACWEVGEPPLSACLSSVSCRALLAVFTSGKLANLTCLSFTLFLGRRVGENVSCWSASSTVAPLPDSQSFWPESLALWRKSRVCCIFFSSSFLIISSRVFVSTVTDSVVTVVVCLVSGFIAAGLKNDLKWGVKGR